MLSSLFVSFSQVKVDYNFNAEVQVFLQSWYHLFFINDFYQGTKLKNFSQYFLSYYQYLLIQFRSLNINIFYNFGTSLKFCPNFLFVCLFFFTIFPKLSHIEFKNGKKFFCDFGTLYDSLLSHFLLVDRRQSCRFDIIDHYSVKKC